MRRHSTHSGGMAAAVRGSKHGTPGTARSNWGVTTLEWLTATIARARRHVAGRPGRLSLAADHGLAAAEWLMVGFVGVLLIAAVGLALRAAFPGVVRRIMRAINAGI
jgi:hypothetical protein